MKRIRRFHPGRFFSVILAAACLVGVTYALGKGMRVMFAITRVEVVGEGIDVAIDPQKLTGNLLFLNTRPLRSEVLSRYPVVESVAFEKVFPHTLRIRIGLRQPVAYLSAEGRTYLADEQGFVVGAEPSDPYALPGIYLPGGVYRVGQQVADPAVRTAIGFILHTRQFLDISRIQADADGTLTVHSREVRIILSDSDDVSGKANALQTIMEGFRIKGELPARVDLRFDKPIVTFH